MVIAMKKIGIKGKYFNITKDIFNKPTANIILSGEKLKSFSLKLGQYKGVHSFHTYLI
jgi:hypothetical protein